MSRFPRWAIPAFLIPAIAFFIGMAIDNESLRIGVKAIPVFVLALVVAFDAPHTWFKRLVAIGLIFGAFGDLLLELGQFVPGLLAFLVGHLFYISALFAKSRRLAPGLAAIFAVWAIGLPWLLAEGAGDLLVPIAAYAVVLCSAMWRSGALLGTAFPRDAAMALFVGFITFGFSDSLIAIDRFGEVDISSWSRWVIMTTYWTAQLLITWGALSSDHAETIEASSESAEIS